MPSVAPIVLGAVIVAVLYHLQYSGSAQDEAFQARLEPNMILYIALGGAAIAFVAFVVTGGVHYARRHRYSP